MACDLTTGFTVGCNDSTGGIAEFWFANMPTDFAVAESATGEASAITGTGLIYYKYETTNAQGAASVINDNPTVNDQNGTSYFDQTCTYVLNKMDTAKRNEVKMFQASWLRLTSWMLCLAVVNPLLGGLRTLHQEDTEVYS